MCRFWEKEEENNNKSGKWWSVAAAAYRRRNKKRTTTRGENTKSRLNSVLSYATKKENGSTHLNTKKRGRTKVYLKEKKECCRQLWSSFLSIPTNERAITASAASPIWLSVRLMLLFSFPSLWAPPLHRPKNKGRKDNDFSCHHCRLFANQLWLPAITLTWEEPLKMRCLARFLLAPKKQTSAGNNSSDGDGENAKDLLLLLLLYTNQYSLLRCVIDDWLTATERCRLISITLDCALCVCTTTSTHWANTNTREVLITVKAVFGFLVVLLLFRSS